MRYLLDKFILIPHPSCCLLDFGKKFIKANISPFFSGMGLQKNQEGSDNEELIRKLYGDMYNNDLISVQSAFSNHNYVHGYIHVHL